MTTRFIVVSGGVVSGLGKGITASTIALLLKTRNYSVNVIKIDPYLNVDSGTMSPFEHGECYVLEDGSETDLDLGNYERFLETNLTKLNSITSGQIYKSVIDNERKGEYLGKTVQMIPHITDEIIKRIEKPLNNSACHYDFCIIELGGTVGDIESSIYLEAIRQLSNLYLVFHIHVSLLPRVGDEDKTKPTQTSIRMLMSKGIFPNMLVIRCQEKINKNVLDKLSLFSNLPSQRIIQNINLQNIYMVPQLFIDQRVDLEILTYFNLVYNKLDYNIISKYNILSDNLLNTPKKKFAIVGKYVGSNDTYLSIIRAIEHASYQFNIRPEICFIENDLTEISEKKIDAIIIPGGFGYRGCEFKLKAIDIAYILNIPILGICLGFQLMIIYLFRNIIGFPNAYHGEWEKFNNDSMSNILMFPINKMDDVYKDEEDKGLGGTMRLGSHSINIKPDTLAHKLYDSNTITERHRHRYGLVEKYRKLLKDDDIVISGYSREAEILEVKNKKFFIGCQYHPEMKSRLNKPHPLFTGLWNAIL